jgi:hypothetical protein
VSSYPWDYSEAGGTLNSRSTLVQIESSKLLPALVACSALAVLGIACAAFAWSIASTARTEARMAEYYITRLDSLLVEQGVVKAGDDYQKFRAEQAKE